MKIKIIDNKGSSKVNLAFLLILGGVIVLAYNMYVFYADPMEDSWEYTEGKVIVSEMNEMEKGTSQYEPSITYEYKVDGQDYDSSMIGLGEYNGSKEKVKALVSKYSVGTSVKVHFDPSYPDVAILEREAVTFPYFALGCSLFSIFLGAFIWIVSDKPWFSISLMGKSDFD